MKDIMDDLEKSLEYKRDFSISDIYEISQGDYRDYPHPGVPVVAVFSNIKPTISELELNDDDFSFENVQKIKNKIYSTGDTSIESYSQLLPLFKWAHEFSHEEKKGQFPVKFVDVCSVINRNDKLFDSSKYEEIFKSNSYIGIFIYKIRFDVIL